MGPQRRRVSRRDDRQIHVPGRAVRDVAPLLATDRQDTLAVFGDSTATAVGAARHQDALAGMLSAAVAGRTGREIVHQGEGLGVRVRAA